MPLAAASMRRAMRATHTSGRSRNNGARSGRALDVARSGALGLRAFHCSVQRLSRYVLRCSALRAIPGFTVPRPDGAFYLFPRIEGLTDSFDFCKRLLEETRVGIAPGVAFGAGGEGSVRICYAAERSILEPALERLAGFVKRSRPTD